MEDRGTASEWRRMLARSFSPQQWYDRDWPEEPESPREDAKMWVYRQVGGAFVVGHWSPDREWNQDSEHATRDQAAARVHYLNGGEGDPHGVAEAARRGYREQ